MFPNQIQPRELLDVEHSSCFGFIHEPFVETLGDGIGERGKEGLLLEREADEGDEVGKAPAWERPLTLPGAVTAKASQRRSSVQAAWFSRSFFSVP